MLAKSIWLAPALAALGLWASLVPQVTYTAIPILHFLTSNPVHFAPIAVVVPLAVALAVVTGSVVSLRLTLKDWHRPAAATAGVTVICFA